MSAGANRRVGLMGGSFDPIHNGHLQIAEAALRELELDEVWFMPTGYSYHKRKPVLAADTPDRAAMVSAAIEGHPHFSLCTEEMDRPGDTYSADTLTVFAERYPDTDFFFLVGADSLDYMDRWVRPEDIFSRCTVAVAMRETQTADETEEKRRELCERFGAKIVLLKTPVQQISSTKLRELFRKGGRVDAFLPKAVEEYAASRHLYGRMARFSNEEILADLEKKLDRERFAHTLRVAGTAVLMADVLGADEDRARLAGILHDAGKYGDREGFAALCDRYGIPVRPVERAHASLLHGKLGAYYARTVYGVDDGEILSAIAWHTTGKPDMTLLEKIIFTADYVEPGRTEAGRLPELRALAFTDIDRAVEYILEDTLRYVRQKERPVDEMTQTAYEWYRKGADHGE